MRNKRKILYAMLLCVLCLVWAGALNQSADTVNASAIGTVDVSGYLNVRKGPGTKYDLVQSGGANVTLSAGDTVTITAVSGNWYHVKFTQNAKTVTGYVLKTYIDVQTGSVHTKIYGLSKSAQTIYEKNGSGFAKMKKNKTEISISKNKKVRILSQVLADGKKWYKISVTKDSVKYKGYLLSANVTLTCSDGLPGVMKNTGKVTLMQEAGKESAVTVDKTKVILKKKNQVTILGEKTVSKKKYLYVKTTFQKKTVKGYLEDESVFLQIVKEESSTTATATPTPATAAPAATVTPTATPTLTTAEFKKQLEEEGFPESYITPLLELHEKYPSWTFKAYKTGLKWSTVIKKESAVGLNLLSNSKSYAWKSTEDGAYDWTKDTFIPYDGSTWVTASKKAVKYYMDPRNFLDERGIFQFESLEYQKESHTKAGVEKILKNTPMYKTNHTYKNDDGEEKTAKYSATFITAAKKSSVSPYHLASRAKQEVVISATTMSSSVSGKVSGYEGIYNFYNIGAYNSTASGGAVANGLKWASSGSTYLRPWNTRYKAIVGGAVYIGKSYINVGQNTLYLQKFNVTSKNTYTHQYMANIEAPNSEATKMNTAYGDEKGEMSMVFSIPVYTDMPESACAVPSGGKNPNNYLKSLYVKSYAFDEKFVLGDDGSKTYTMTVPNSVSSIKICATKVASAATITGDGVVNVEVGTNVFTVKVKSESGETRKYKIQVTRKEA